MWVGGQNPNRTHEVKYFTPPLITRKGTVSKLRLAAAVSRNGTRSLTVLFKIAERGFQRAIDDCVI
jgi:hypothetical protein